MLFLWNILIERNFGWCKTLNTVFNVQHMDVMDK